MQEGGSPRLTRRRLLQFALTLGVAAPFAVTLAGCGSGNGQRGIPFSTGSTDRITLATGRARVALDLPTGFSYPLTQMRLVNSLGSFGVNPDATVDAAVFGDGDTLAILQLADGTPVLAGWIGASGGILSPRSTAEVLLHLALAAPLHSADALAAFFAALESSPALDGLAESLRTALAANPAALGQSTSGVAPALQTALTQLNTRSVRPPATHPITRGILIDPDETKSGVQVVQGDGINTIRAINHYRLRRLAFVDRVSYVPSGGGGEQPSPAEIGKFDISPTHKLTGVFSGISDGVIALFGYGDSPWAEIQTDPVTVPTYPDDAQKTTYKVKVVGPAGIYTPENEPFLSSDQMQEYRLLTVKALWLDFVLPFMLNVVLPAKNFSDVTRFKDQLPALFNAWWKLYGGDVVALLGGTLPGILDKLYQGKAPEAFKDFLVALVGSDTARRALIGMVANFLSFAVVATGGVALDPAVASAALAKVLTTLGVISALIATVDEALQARNWQDSRWLETWDITVTPAKVSLTPTTAEVEQLGRADFKVTVADGDAPAGTPYTYRWECTGNAGGITDGLHTGTSFDSSVDSVVYIANVDAPFDATDTITVTVFLGGINDPNRREIGKVSSTVKIATINITGHWTVIGYFFDLDYNLVDTNGTITGTLTIAGYETAPITGTRKGKDVQISYPLHVVQQNTVTVFLTVQDSDHMVGYGTNDQWGGHEDVTFTRVGARAVQPSARAMRHDVGVLAGLPAAP